MLPIHKHLTDPLREYRSTQNATYEDSPKEALRQNLLQEQKFLCAYCMSRITEKTMSVEHWQCRSNYPAQELSYQNLLAVCDGNEGQPPCKQHCDTRKGDKDLAFNPADPTHHARLKIRYLWSTGKIESEDAAFCTELGGEKRGTEGILNLNLEKLKNNRRAVIRRVERTLQSLPSNARKAQIQPLLVRWNTADSQGMLPEYAGVAIYFLEKRLAKAQ